MKSTFEKLKILADGAKYDVSCSSSGVGRKNTGKIGNSTAAGICHSWSADGRCISLLKILFTNKCVFDCEYCVNRRSADVPRASFEPKELARLAIEFYRRNYIEGLFLSSAVEVSPDFTAERILSSLRLLRDDYGFEGISMPRSYPAYPPKYCTSSGLWRPPQRQHRTAHGKKPEPACSPEKAEKHLRAHEADHADAGGAQAAERPGNDV
jgi:predicted DNA-binding helix-hairpin-helix protein